MSDWFHDLPVPWMALLIFGFTYLTAAGVYAVVSVLAVGERARAFKAVSSGMLPPLGIMFALFVAFTAAQVWSDNDRAAAAVSGEARALRSAQVLAASLPGQPEAQLRDLIRRYIEEAVSEEWPMMAQRIATLQAIPGALAQALQLTLALTPSTPGQQIAQREIVTALENALDARRQRILISRSQVNFVKWTTLYLQAVCALVAIAMVHSDNRLASLITMGLFATGVAAAVLLIAAHDRPFLGQLSVGPAPLLQVMPEAETDQRATNPTAKQ
jgi:hypothetical protein